LHGYFDTDGVASNSLWPALSPDLSSCDPTVGSNEAKVYYNKTHILADLKAIIQREFAVIQEKEQ
jgi:hypothetical protein